MNLSVRLADLSNPADLSALVELTRAYARDEQALGRDLEDDVVRRLPDALRAHPAVSALLALDGDLPIGQATCLLSFSTFQARPILNIHDLNVLADYRGQGVAKALMDAVFFEAKARGCCRVTLEVSATNERARRVYAAAGFKGAFETAEERITYFCGRDLD